MAGLNLCSLAVPEKPLGNPSHRRMATIVSVKNRGEAAVEQEVILDWEIDMQGSFGERFCSYQ